MKQNQQTLWVGLTFLALGLLIGLLAKDFGTSPKSNELALNPDLPNQAALVSVSEDDDAVLGDPDAPVTIVEFSDYQCPFCRSFFTETYPLIKANYIDTGKVKLVFRDLPLASKHPQASMAAQAAECVGESGDEAYYKMHDLIFEKIAEWSGNTEAEAVFVAMAATLGEDIAECLAEEKMASEVASDQTAAVGYGVRSTPSFFVNGSYVKGALPYEVFEQTIEAALKATK